MQEVVRIISKPRANELSADALGDLKVISADTSTPRCRANDGSRRAHAAIREPAPQLTCVLSAGEELVSLDDGITRVEERRATRLELHPVNDELQQQRVSMLGDQRACRVRSLLVEIAEGNGAVLECGGREECSGEPVLGDELLLDDPEDLGPDFTDGVNTPVTSSVEDLVSRRVDSRVGRVRVVTDTAGLVGSPSAHRVIRVVGRAANSRSDEITPSLAHTTTLAPPKTSTVGRATSKTGAKTVSKLVDDNASFEVTISVRSSSVPDVHAATTILSVRGSSKVGVVVSAAVLCVGDDSVTFLASLSEVVLLEVSGLLVKAISVQQVMEHVGSVEHLGDGQVCVILRSDRLAILALGSVLVHELQVFRGRSVVVLPVVGAFPVLMGEDLMKSNLISF